MGGPHKNIPKLRFFPFFMGGPHKSMGVTHQFVYTNIYLWGPPILVWEAPIKISQNHEFYFFLWVAPIKVWGSPLYLAIEKPIYGGQLPHPPQYLWGPPLRPHKNSRNQVFFLSLWEAPIKVWGPPLNLVQDISICGGLSYLYAPTTTNFNFFYGWPP